MDAFLEDMYFIHEYEGYYYGYRQNKCFKFNKQLLLVETFEVIFPFDTYLGCPVYTAPRQQSQLDNLKRFGIEQKTGKIYCFMAHSIVPLNIDSYFTQPWSYCVVPQGILVFDVQKCQPTLLKITDTQISDPNCIQAVKVPNIAGSDVQLYSVSNKIYVFNPNNLKIFDAYTYNLLNTIVVDAGQIQLAQNNIIVTLSKTGLKLFDLTNAVQPAIYSSKITNKIFQGAQIVKVKKQITLLSPTDNKQRNARHIFEETFNGFLFDKYEEFLPKLQHVILNDQNEALVEHEVQIERLTLLNSSLEHQVGIMKAQINDQQNEIQKLKNQNQNILEMLSKQMEVSKQILTKLDK
ncbi:Hypothetical_protein [Hexamita inflata]|uniref:Hypothetical_protein n=1 Tax=Hexamita inflata TaxID=28002 RepID=A0AA86PBQ5_9EUKA|nr:Hypothetical protein HINF_LOCUS20482 [Hexamita inflata]